MLRRFHIILMSLFTLVQISFAQVNTDRLLTIGRNALYFEDYVLSIQYFNQVIHTKPHLNEPYFFRAYAKFNLGDNIGAIQDCDLALEINPYLIDAYNIRGICKQQTGNYESADSDFAKGLIYDAKNTSLMMNRGIGMLELDSLKSAIQLFSDAIDVKSGNMLAYLNRGRAFLLNQDTVNARNDLNKALEINPFNMQALAMRGALLSELKEWESAEKDFESAIKLDAKKAYLFLNRAVTRYYQNNLNGAISDYNKTIELDPNNNIAYFNRALLRSQIGDLNRAVEDYDMVLRIEPENLTARFNRALVYVQIGEHYAAINDLNKVINQHPDFPVAYYARSEAKAGINDNEGAALDYNTGYTLEFDRPNQKKNSKDKDLAINPSNDDEKSERKNSDKDIRNYKKIVILDDENSKEKTGFDNTIRGKIQNRNIAIDLERDIMISFYPDHRVLEKSPYFSQLVNSLNNSKVFDAPLYLSKAEHQVTNEEIAKHFERISELRKKIENTSENKYYYFERAIHFSLVKDFTNALEDLNKAIEIDPNFTLAIFLKGAVRYKMVEFIRSIDDFSTTESVVSVNPLKKNSSTNSQPKKAQEKILDYELVLFDYNNTEKLNKGFAFSYYNRGNVRAALKDYKGAIDDYTRAIKVEPQLAEAYYNRGLTYIYLGEQEKGTRDLSKSGELGLFKAYNVLKRYGIAGF